ncbi:olfactory receptor 6M1-like [Lissotriton helveticus]
MSNSSEGSLEKMIEYPSFLLLDIGKTMFQEQQLAQKEAQPPVLLLPQEELLLAAAPVPYGTVMKLGNKTTVTDVILAGFTGGTGLRISLFIILLLVYTATMVGNVMMIVLSFFYLYLATNVFFFLPIMSYDRYVAICNPLHYTTIMSRKFCIQLVIGSWLGSLTVVLYPTILITMLPYCGPNIIDHFFCDGQAAMKLACGDTVHLSNITLISGLLLLLSSLGLTCLSYIFIISSILKIPSRDGRQKTFSTCSSHLIMVTIIYGSAIFVEVSPMLHPSAGLYKTVNLFSSFLSQLMNPFVYTYRNTVFKEVIKNQVCGDVR